MLVIIKQIFQSAEIIPRDYWSSRNPNGEGFNDCVGVLRQSGIDSYPGLMYSLTIPNDNYVFITKQPKRTEFLSVAANDLYDI